MSLPLSRDRPLPLRNQVLLQHAPTRLIALLVGEIDKAHAVLQ